MNVSKNTRDDTRIVLAPPPSDPQIPPSIYYVEVANHLDVQWKWTTLPDGNRVVTNYQLIPKSELDLVRT